MKNRKFLFIQLNPENKFIIKKLKIMFLICGLLSVFLSIMLYLINFFIWGFYFSILTAIWICGFYYIVFYIQKISKIKYIIIATPFIITVIFFLEMIAQVLGWYDDANHFFIPPRFDLISHFFSGMIIFLVLLMILSLFEMKYRIENIVLILTIILLFLWELFEELIIFGLKDQLIGLENRVFWNSFQDMIMNCLGAFFIYFLLKKYLIKRIKVIIFE